MVLVDGQPTTSLVFPSKLMSTSSINWSASWCQREDRIVYRRLQAGHFVPVACFSDSSNVWCAPVQIVIGAKPKPGSRQATLSDLATAIESLDFITDCKISLINQTAAPRSQHRTAKNTSKVELLWGAYASGNASLQSLVALASTI